MILLILFIVIIIVVICSKYIEWVKIEKAGKDRGFRVCYEIITRWLIIHNTGRTIDEFFVANGLFNIVVYGAGPLGELLCHELNGTDIKVKFVIDRDKKRFENSNLEIPVFPPVFLNRDENIDAIVITSIIHEKQIMDTLCAMNLPDRIRFIMMDEVVNYYYHHGKNK